jgi:hypothetical protein
MKNEDELNRRAAIVLREAMDDPRFEVVGRLAQSLDLLGGYPTISRSESLHALVAPDGVMVRIVDKSISQQDLEEIVRADIMHRLLREEHVEHIRMGKSLVECLELLVPKFARLKTVYKLERLS